MIIRHNMMAMNAQRQISTVGKRKAKSTEKLSSGYKINRSADDAAGLSISEKMRKQIRGLSQGVRNTQDGVSLCQVADGALAEVNDMLHRITELSVKAANGTWSPKDRQAMQDEISHLRTEINRIGDTTKFNELHIFRGKDIPLFNPDGTPMIEGFIPFEDFSIADVNLGNSPFGEGSGSDSLQLQAVVANESSVAYGKTYDLVFGSGSTSSSSIRLTYDVGEGEVSQVVSFNTLSPSNYNSGVDNSGNTYWTRDLIYENDEGVGIKITQKITADSTGATEKNYKISYSFENFGGVNVNMDFLFHVDTAYNNDDLCEGYFVNGNRVEKSCIYSKNNSPFTAGQTNSNIINGIPDSLSIIDMDSALSFAEKISFDSNSKPDSFSLGYFHNICNWDYYDSLDSNLGRNMIQSDLGFGLMWHYDMSAGNSRSVSFNYGITATQSDANLQGVPLKRNNTQMFDHVSNQNVWIQSGADAGDGILVNLSEMSTAVLGIDKLNVSTMEGATKALDLLDNALKYVSLYRSSVGAQQNRMEHTIANENNVVENTTSAESLIRDTDMAAEMVQNSKENILEQAGQMILAQANQSRQGVLSLLQ